MAAGGVSDEAMVFAEGHVAMPVQGFDAPVLAIEVEQRSSVRQRTREAGNCVDDLNGFLAAAFRRACELAGLSEPWPIIIPGQAGAGRELPPLPAAMSLVAGFSLRKLLLPLAFCGGGKIRAENQPQWLLSGSVDYP